NFNDQVDEIYLKRGGTNYYTEAKTPADAKAKIREEIRRDRALHFAQTNAVPFAEEATERNPTSATNLDFVAHEKGYTVGLTAPFDAQHGPTDLEVPATFARAAFKLTPDEPIGGPLVADDGIYIIALRDR